MRTCICVHSVMQVVVLLKCSSGWVKHRTLLNVWGYSEVNTVWSSNNKRGQLQRHWGAGYISFNRSWLTLLFVLSASVLVLFCKVLHTILLLWMCLKLFFFLKLCNVLNCQDQNESLLPHVEHKQLVGELFLIQHTWHNMPMDVQ